MKKKKRSVRASRKSVQVPFYKKRIVHIIVGTLLIIFGVLLLQNGQ